MKLGSLFGHGQRMGIRIAELAKDVEPQSDAGLPAGSPAERVADHLRGVH